jgi:hypothetical protein
VKKSISVANDSQKLSPPSLRKRPQEKVGSRLAWEALYAENQIKEDEKRLKDKLT